MATRGLSVAIKATINNTNLIKGQVAFDVTYTVFSSLSVETSSLRASKQLEMSSVGEEGSPGEETDIVYSLGAELAIVVLALKAPHPMASLLRHVLIVSDVTVTWIM